MPLLAVAPGLCPLLAVALACRLNDRGVAERPLAPSRARPSPPPPTPALTHILAIYGNLHRLSYPFTIYGRYSFLDNKRTPASVTRSVRRPPPPTDLSPTALAPLLTDEAKASRVLAFATLGDLFRTLPPAEQGAEIKRMNEWTSIWCCSQPPRPRAAGHVWYDMFWDIVPHTNRHNKLLEAVWTPSFGP